MDFLRGRLIEGSFLGPFGILMCQLPLPHRPIMSIWASQSSFNTKGGGLHLLAGRCLCGVECEDKSHEWAVIIDRSQVGITNGRNSMLPRFSRSALV